MSDDWDIQRIDSVDHQTVTAAVEQVQADHPHETFVMFWPDDTPPPELPVEIVVYHVDERVGGGVCFLRRDGQSIKLRGGQVDIGLARFDSITGELVSTDKFSGTREEAMEWWNKR